MVAEANIDDRARREELGQFLTSASVAGFMASLFGPLPARLCLLDAGAGAGALTSAFIDLIHRLLAPGGELMALPPPGTRLDLRVVVPSHQTP